MSEPNNPLRGYEALINRIQAALVAAPDKPLDPELIKELTDLTYSRLRLLVAKILNTSFPAVGRRHEVDSVLNTVWLRLHAALTALAKQERLPPTPADFCRLATTVVKRVLFDLIRTDRRFLQAPEPEAESGIDLMELSHHTLDPVRKVLWREMLARVEVLPPDQKDVFELRFYGGLTQALIARLLNMPPRTVSRRWKEAVAAVADLVVAIADVMPE